MRRLLFLALLVPFQWVYAAQDLPSIDHPAPKDPKEIIYLQLRSLDHLRSMTKLTLEKIDELYAAIVKYQTVQDLYLKQTNDKELLHRMTKMASQLLQQIHHANLQHTIDPEFIKELKLLTKIYKKNELPIE